MKLHIYVASTLGQFVYGSLLGGLSTILSLSISYFLDRAGVNPHVSTFIGFLVNYTLNFYISEIIFTGVVKKPLGYVPRYVVTTAATFAVAQLGFYLLFRTWRKPQKWWWKSFLRWFTSAVAFVLVTFPLEKYWVFSTRVDA